MRIRMKINLLFCLMAAASIIVFVIAMQINTSHIAERKDIIHAAMEKAVEADVRMELSNLAGSVGQFAVAFEDEIDKNMLNAAYVLYEADMLSRQPLTFADLDSLRERTGMSDLYLGDRNGVFTVSTERKSLGMSLFDIWDGYRMLVTGESDYLPSLLKIKEETGEIFKFTAIPRADGRGVIESALSAENIEEKLQNFITSANGIIAMNLFDSAGLVLTENLGGGGTSVYKKGDTVDVREVKTLFDGSAGETLSMSGGQARIYSPVAEDGAVKYVLFMEVDTDGYYQMARMLEMPFNQLLSQTKRTNGIIAAVMAGLVLVFILMTAITSGRMLRPLDVFNRTLQSLAEGDFTVSLPEKIRENSDEMGMMARSFDEMIENVGSMVKTVQHTTGGLATAGDSLAANAEETQGQVRNIGVHMGKVSEKADVQTVSVSTVSSSVEEIVKNIEVLDGVIVRQATALDQSSSGIEKMIESITSVNHNLEKIASQFDSLVAASKNGLEKQEQVEAQVRNIVGFSQTLSETNEIIANISSQTNLLAMNAAIEAAHAGEAGQGFAVVADEIRKLAENSGNQSRAVGQQLREIQSGIQTIVNSSAESKSSFDMIAEQIDILNDLVDQVSSTVSLQSDGSRRILADLKDITSVTQEVKSGAAEMRTGSQTIVKEMMQLQDVSQAVQMNMQEVSTGVSEIGKAASTVLQVAIQTKEGIREVSEKLNLFRV